MFCWYGYAETSNTKANANFGMFMPGKYVEFENTILGKSDMLTGNVFAAILQLLEILSSL